MYRKIESLAKNLTKDEQIKVGQIIEGKTVGNPRLTAIANEMRGLGETIGQEGVALNVLRKEAFEKYPRNYVQYGEKLKTMVFQKKRNFFGKHKDPHLYLFGFPGSGKTSLLKFIYPNYYKKDLQNKFWDLYDEEHHTHVMLEDLDSVVLEKHLSIQFLKTICDEAGFPIDQKYKTPQVTRATILITSNQDIDGLVNNLSETRLVEDTKKAIRRRFLQLRVDTLQRLLGVKLINDYERKLLKKEGNEDPSKLYIDWNYDLDSPTGLPLKKPEEYQQMIRDYYFR